MRNIKLITFDLDDTFWDIGPPIIKAEKETRHWLNEKGCLGCLELPVNAWIALRQPKLRSTFDQKIKL